MKKYILLLVLASFFTISFSQSEEEEIQVISIDGNEYKVNPYSKNLTPLDDAITNNNTTKNSIGAYNLNLTIGNISPFGENLRDRYNPGYNLGFSLNTPKTFTFFKKDWRLDAHLNFIKLPSNSDYKEINITTFSSDLTTNFGPMSFSFGLGFSPYSSSYNDGTKLDYSTFLTATANIGYTIFKSDQFDLSLNLHMQHIMGSPKDGFGNRGTSELFGLNLLVGKSFSF